jgi:micrococcal nuclease
MVNSFGMATLLALLSTGSACAQWLLPAGYRIGVVRYVVDGDTVNVNISKSQWTLGGRAGLRVDGIDTPEVHKVNAKCPLELARGEQAKLFAQSLMPRGTVLRFYPVKARDKYGRILARVVLPDGSDLAQRMLAYGLAQQWNGHGPKPNWCEK